MGKVVDDSVREARREEDVGKGIPRYGVYRERETDGERERESVGADRRRMKISRNQKTPMSRHDRKVSQGRYPPPPPPPPPFFFFLFLAPK